MTYQQSTKREKISEKHRNIEVEITQKLRRLVFITKVTAWLTPHWFCGYAADKIPSGEKTESEEIYRD